MSRFWNFSDISIGDRDTSHFCAVLSPSFQKVGHVTTRGQWSRDHPIGDPWFAISRFWNLLDISIGDQDTSLNGHMARHQLSTYLHFCAVLWPSFQKVGHVTIRDHWSRDHQIGDPWFAISRFWNYTDISIGHQVIASKMVVRMFCMGISPKKRNLTLWYTIDKNRCDIWVSQIYEPIWSSGQNFDISTFKGVYPSSSQCKSLFLMANFLSPTFLGVIFCYFWVFWGVNVKFCVFDPQKALPYPKRHLPVYFMKLSDKRCPLHPSWRTQKRWAIWFELLAIWQQIVNETRPWKNLLSWNVNTCLSSDFIGHVVCFVLEFDSLMIPCYINFINNATTNDTKWKIRNRRHEVCLVG